MVSKDLSQKYADHTLPTVTAHGTHLNKSRSHHPIPNRHSSFTFARRAGLTPVTGALGTEIAPHTLPHSTLRIAPRGSAAVLDSSAELHRSGGPHPAGRGGRAEVGCPN